jgi:hypothetical protein
MILRCLLLEPYQILVGESEPIPRSLPGAAEMCNTLRRRNHANFQANGGIGTQSANLANNQQCSKLARETEFPAPVLVLPEPVITVLAGRSKVVLRDSRLR